MEELIRIGICDDHTLFRKGLVGILSSIPQFEVVKDFTSGEELLAGLAQLDVDVILLDINMEGRNGIEVLKQVKALRPKIGMIILSMNPPRLFGVRALKASALSYLHKDCTEEDLVHTIFEASKGNRYLTSELSEQLLSVTDNGKTINILDALTDRELEIIIKLADNYSNKEISKELSISEKTVSAHKKNILTKLGVNNLMEAVKLLEI